MNKKLNEITYSSFKQNFEDKYSKYKSQRKPWTQDKIKEVKNNIQNARVTMVSNTRKTPMEYYWLNKYDILTIDNEDCLIFKKKTPQEPTIQIIPYEEYFNILVKIHENCGHGGRDKMLQDIKTKYYIPKKAIEIFVSLCPTCDSKRNVPKRGIVSRPMVSQDFNIRGVVSLINFQSCSNGEFKWLLNYQDNATKFVSLRPLKTNKESEVATELLKIFLIFGAPYILQSDIGSEFTVKVITELMLMWPDCKIVLGNHKTHHTGSRVENTNQNIDNILRIWMNENNTLNWSAGCFFVQYQINSTLHRTIGKSPYQALFGSDPKAGLSDSVIPPTLLVNIDTEEKLKKLSETNQQFKDYALSDNCDLGPESTPNNPIENTNMEVDASYVESITVHLECENDTETISDE